MDALLVLICIQLDRLIITLNMGIMELDMKCSIKHFAMVLEDVFLQAVHLLYVLVVEMGLIRFQVKLLFLNQQEDASISLVNAVFDIIYFVLFCNHPYI